MSMRTPTVGGPRLGQAGPEPRRPKTAGRRRPTERGKPGQLALPHVSPEAVRRSRGGKRANAGRKRAAGKRESVPHRARPAHVGRHPVHVTLRARHGLPSLRSQRVSGMLRSVLLGQRKRKYAQAFQVVEYSIQDNHLHLMVEAVGATAHDSLRSGISGFAIAFAKRLNLMLGRKGKVWGDRWHGRELSSPREVRNILGYIFRNVVKHGARVYGQRFADPLSSAPRFEGWTRHVVRIHQHQLWPPNQPRTWLLERGWKIHGLLDPDVLARPSPKDIRPAANRP